MSILTQGKVILADIFGDKALLKAMKLNEDATNIAYEHAVEEAAFQAGAGLDAGWPDYCLVVDNIAGSGRHAAPSIGDGRG